MAVRLICVDQFQMMHRLARHRLMAAHELKHLVLHQDLYEETLIEALDSSLAPWTGRRVHRDRGTAFRLTFAV